MIKKKEHSRVLTSSSSSDICVEHLSSIVLIMEYLYCAGLMRLGVFEVESYHGGNLHKQNDTHTSNNTASLKQ